MDNNKYLINLLKAIEKNDNIYNSDDYSDYYIAKITSESIFKKYNTERFFEVLKDKYFIVKYNGRVFQELNPHINMGACANYRIDNICGTFIETRQISESIKTYRNNVTILFDVIKGSVKRHIPKGVVICATCGSEVVKNEKMGKYCKYCITNSSKSEAYYFGYHDYNGGYTTPKGIDTTKNVVMGVEIERDTLSNNANRNRAILDTLKALKGDTWYNTKRDNVFMRDGSLDDGGIEWITFPQTYTTYRKNKEKYQNALNSMEQHGFGCTRQCGNHIHVNTDYFGKKENDQCIAGCKLAILFTKYWDEFVAISGRNSFGYCENNNIKDTDDIFTCAIKTLNKKYDHGVAVNLQHTNTIELRLWGGINNADDLLLFLDITQSLARLVKNTKRIETIQKTSFAKCFKYLRDSNHIDMIIEKLRAKHKTRYINQLVRLKEKTNGGN